MDVSEYENVIAQWVEAQLPPGFPAPSGPGSAQLLGERQAERERRARARLGLPDDGVFRLPVTHPSLSPLFTDESAVEAIVQRGRR